MEVEKFVGLSKKDAQDLAEQLNLIFRLIRVNDKDVQNYPEDKREDRICVEIDKGKISKVVLQ